MTSFRVTPSNAAKLYYTVKILFAQDFNWHLTKTSLTLSNDDYTSGFSVSVPVVSDGEEEFSMISEYAMLVLESMRSEAVYRVDFGSLTVMSPISGITTQYLINSYHAKNSIHPSKWGESYVVNTEEYDTHATARIAMGNYILLTRSVVEMSHGNIYLGSATVPNAFVLKSKAVSNVPDYITSSAHAYAAGWLSQVSPGAPVTMNVTDTHVRTNVGEDFIYTARYNFEPHLMEKALLSVHLKEFVTVPFPATTWWEILPAEHRNNVTVELKNGVLTLKTRDLYGSDQVVETPVDSTKEFSLEFMPNSLPTALGLLGRTKDGTMTVPTSGTGVVLESEKAETLVPAVVKVKE